MSTYLGRRGLEQLRAQLADRDLAVINSLKEHRFLTARQIEELHFHDHASDEASARVCRRVLARLTRDRLVARLHRRIGGIRAGSASFVYGLGPVGGRLLDGHRRRLTEPSPLFLDHTLAVAETRLQLLRAERQGWLELVAVEVEPACWRLYSGPGGARESVKPDLYVVTASDAYDHFWFLEIDRGTESPAAISRKCRAYDLYWRAGTEQAKHGAFPLVTWVVPDTARLRRIESTISRAKNLKRELFRVTTSEGLVELVAGGAE